MAGGGLSDLSPASQLQGDTIVLEEQAKVGAVCAGRSSGTVESGHSFHTPHAEARDLIQDALVGGTLPTDARPTRLEPRYSHPLPFQNSYDQIPDTDVVRTSEEGLRNRESHPPEPELRGVQRPEVGQGIAEHFMFRHW